MSSIALRVVCAALAAVGAAAQADLRIGVLLSWNGGLFDIGEFIAPAILAAADDVNADPTLLVDASNTTVATLSWVWHDEQCSATRASNAMVELVKSYDVHAFIGPTCSTSAQRVAPMSNYYGRPVVSYAAAAPDLADKTLYPNFARVSGNYNDQTQLIIEFALQNRWSRLAILYVDDGLYSPVALDLIADIENLADPDDNTPPPLEVSFSKLFAQTTTSNAGQSLDFMQTLKDEGTRIVVILASCRDARDIMISADQLGMIEGYSYIFLGATSTCHEVTGDDWPEGWGPEADSIALRAFNNTLSVADLTDDSSTGFANRIRNAYVDNDFQESLGQSAPPAGTALPVSGSMPRVNPFNQTYAEAGQFEEYTMAYARLLYDAILLYAHAATEVYREGGLVHEQPNLVIDKFSSVSFAGESGAVSLDSNYERERIDVDLQQITIAGDQLTFTSVGSFDTLTSTLRTDTIVYPGGSTVPPVAFIERECSINDFVALVGECNSDSEVEITFQKITGRECTGSTPEASADCAHLPSDSSGADAVRAFAIIGVLQSVIFAIWAFFCQNTKIVRHAQVSFLFLFCLGCAAGNVSSLFTIGENGLATCEVAPWLFHTSFTFSFGALLSKVFRVWRILDPKKLARRVMSLVEMIQVVGVLLFIDVVLLTLIVVTDSLTARDETETADGADVPVTQKECGDGGDLLVLLWAIKVLTMFAGCFLSCQMRQLNEKFSETKYVSYAIYQVTAMAAVATLIVSLSDSVELSVTVQAFAVWISTLGASLAIFLPKMLFLHGCVDEDALFGAPEDQMSIGDRKESPHPKEFYKAAVASSMGPPSTEKASKAPPSSEKVSSNQSAEKPSSNKWEAKEDVNAQGMPVVQLPPGTSVTDIMASSRSESNVSAASHISGATGATGETKEAAVNRAVQ